MGLFDRFTRGPQPEEAKQPVSKPAGTGQSGSPHPGPLPKGEGDKGTSPQPPAEQKAEPEPPKPEPVKKGFFARIKDGLKKTTQLLNTDIRDLFKGEGRLVDDAFIEELRE